MTLDERVARLEERANHIMAAVDRIELQLQRIDEKIERLQANHAYLRGKMNGKTVVGISTAIVGLWEILKRILGV